MADSIEQYINQYEMQHFLNQQMLQHLRRFDFAAGTNIYIAEDEQHYLYFLVEGQLQCYHYHLNGKLAVFAISNPFTVIGELEILKQETVWSNVVATRDTTMLGIARDIVHEHGAEDPRFLRFVIEQLQQKLFASNALQMANAMPLLHRLIAYLLSQPTEASGTLTLPSKESLASLLGATARHLNRAFKVLHDAGLIEGPYAQIQIVDHTAMREMMY